MNKIFTFLIVLPLVGCAGIVGQTLSETGVADEGLGYVVVADPSSPQVAGTCTVTWRVQSVEEAKRKKFSFELRDKEGNVDVVQEGFSPIWSWRPQTAGEYSVRVQVDDILGNKVTSPWSPIYKIAPALEVTNPVAGMEGPQVADTVTIPWTALGTGGVGEKNYTFEVRDQSGETQLFQVGLSGRWNWKPLVGGEYQVRVIVTDALGNQRASQWSEVYSIADPLYIKSLLPGKNSPQAAQTGPISWTVTVSGGLEPKKYDFELSRNGDDWRQTQVGSYGRWIWHPEEQGAYRVRVLVTDALGNFKQMEWGQVFTVAPPLSLAAPVPDNSSPDYKLDSTIHWSVKASGGVGPTTLSFQVENQKEELSSFDTETSPNWTWKPNELGVYRIRAVLTDSVGNQKLSNWSEWKTVKGSLAIQPPEPSLPSPQRAFHGEIRWSVASTGGVGDITYEFLTLKGGIASLEQRGHIPYWNWSPGHAGFYKIKVRASDRDGQVVETPWTDDFLILPTVTPDSLFAILPLENLSGTRAPLLQIEKNFAEILSKQIQLLPEGDLDNFMYNHRMRDTGTIGAKLAEALQHEVGVDAVFITSLETWFDSPRPKVSLICRLVSTGSSPEILWMDSIGLTGEDHVGLLGLGRITNIQVLLGHALGQLVDSFRSYLEGKSPTYRHPVNTLAALLVNGDIGTADGSLGNTGDKHQPEFYYRASFFEPAGKYSLAVVPFLNINARKHAETIAALHLMAQLHRYENIKVFEPGLIREKLLKYRLIMQYGPSLAAADVLADKNLLGADLVVSGRVFDYQDRYGVCKFRFSILSFDMMQREIVWASRSNANGDDGVFFFDVGKILSASDLASQMSRGVVKLFLN